MNWSRIQIIFTDNTTTITLRARNIVTESLVKDILEFVHEEVHIAATMSSFLDTEVRESIIRDVSMLFSQLHEHNVIDQWDVICDKRNNSKELADDGISLLELRFRQWNCLVTTSLLYKVEKKVNKSNKKPVGKRIVF